DVDDHGIGGLSRTLAGYVPNHSGRTEQERKSNERILSGLSLHIRSGANVDLQRRDNGYTPLHEAALLNAPEMARLFLDAGADRNIRDFKRQLTPLELAEHFQKRRGVSYAPVIEVLKSRQCKRVAFWRNR